MRTREYLKNFVQSLQEFEYRQYLLLYIILSCFALYSIGYDNASLVKELSSFLPAFMFFISLFVILLTLPPSSKETKIKSFLFGFADKLGSVIRTLFGALFFVLLYLIVSYQKWSDMWIIFAILFFMLITQFCISSLQYHKENLISIEVK